MTPLQRALFTVALTGVIGLAGLSVLQAKEASLTVTAQQRANAVRNAARYGWARSERAAAEKAAERWKAMSDEELWALIPSQELPRSIHVYNIAGTNKTALCPECKEGIIPFGNYPWRCDVFGKPWKVTCPNPKCQAVFPSNDFGAYYRSALDKHGFFRRGKGDPKLLFNTAHPDPNDPLHRAYVDDGYGWTDVQGTRWDFIAVYVQWGLWTEIKRAIANLTRAYTLTEDPVYAHKCGVLLARLADVYPEMDFWPLHEQGFSHSHGGRGMGKVEGSIWETGNGSSWALAYDQIFDALIRDTELAAFVNEMHRRQELPPTPDPKAVAAHIERGLIREIITAVKDGRIHGNQGMHQRTMIAAALALDDPKETPQLIDWVFAPGTYQRDPNNPGREICTGGSLAQVLVSVMDRDGLGNEGAPGYSLWGASLQPAADLLEDNAKYRARSIYRDFPKYRQYYLACKRWTCLEAATPPIGDSGAASAWGIVAPGAQALLRAYEIYRDPALARFAWQMLGRKLDRVHGSIFSENPEALREEVARLVSGPEPPLESGFMDGWGLAVLQAPHREHGRALWVYYGRNTGHGHKDRLNLGLYAENIDMLPDLGYPEYASGRPKDSAWCRNNASHNVVTVDGSAQNSSYTGRLLSFEPEGKARLVDLSSDGIYPNCTTYRRTAWLVDASARSSYVLDLFRVRGGKEHTLSLHGPPGEVTATGLVLKRQEKGTFAGPDVPFEALDKEWRSKAGFSFLYNVERMANPPATFTLDYRAMDTRNRIAEGREPHLRIHSLTPAQEAALADGDPPQNKRGAPRRMRYLLLTRKGENLESTFVTLLEPYDRQPFIQSVRRLEVVEAAPGTHPVAVEVTLADGRRDVLISCETPGRVRVDGGITLEGAHGFLSLRDGQVECAKLIEGTLLERGAFRLTAETPAYTGTLARVLADDPNDQQLELSAPLPNPKALAGRTIFVENDGKQGAAYTVVSAQGARVSLGAMSLVRGYQDPNDYAEGYLYNVLPGQSYRIPTFAYVDLATGARIGSADSKP